MLKFAGDAMFALWPMEDDDLLNSLQRAIQCGLDMQLRLSNYGFKFHERDADGREIQDKVKYEGVLNVKVGIGIGEVSIVHVGGESDNVMPERYEYVATGPALDEAFASESVAKAGMVIVSKAVQAMVKTHFEMEPLPDKQKRFYLVKDWKTEVRWKKGNAGESETTSLEAEARVWKYVPAAVLPYLNESNEFWAPELRRVTTLFCSLGFDPADLASLHPQIVQDVFVALQRSVFQFEGTINKFLVDDKGSTLIAVFGLPPFAHENDATRGTLAAMSILSSLHELGKNGSIGITTGVAFCGVVGTRGNRREYSVIGDTINTAARLMVESKKRDSGHLMDEATAKSVSDDLSIESVGSVQLKGKAHEIPIFQVAGGQEAPSMQMARVMGSVYQPPPTPRTPTKAKEVHTAKSEKKMGRKKKTDLALLPPAIDPPPVPDNGNAALRVQRDQMAAITEAPKLRKLRDDAIKTRVAGKSADARDQVLAKGMESFAASSHKGLAMGTGRAKEPGEMPSPSPPAITLQNKRVVKAAQIRFDNCATSASNEALTTTFTLPLVEGIETFADLKDAAVTRLGGRQLLKRGPEVDRGFFALRWADDVPGRASRVHDDLALADADVQGQGPIIKLVLVEFSEHPSGPTTRAHDYRVSVKRATDTLKSQLEDARNTVLKGDRGRVVIVEGQHGVGKSRMAAKVFLHPGSIADVYTGVAMGNPYETERLERNFSVWNVLLKQLVEEAMSARGMTTDDDDDGGGAARLEAATQIVTKAVKAVAPDFADARLPELVDVVTCFETGVSVKSQRASFQPGLGLANQPSEASAFSQRVELMAQVVLGLSMEKPIVVLIDDSHFMDLGSWHLTLKLADLIASRSAKMLIVLLHRALILADSFVSSTQDRAAASKTVDVLSGVDRHNMRAIENQHTRARKEVARLFDSLLGKDGVLHVEKKSDPSPATTREIILETLNAESVPQELVTELTGKSHGNALYIKDALSSYVAEDLLKLKGKAVELSDAYRQRSKYSELPVPPSVEGICATLLDTMSTTQQIALKVAAMIGEQFTLTLVRAVFPISALKDGLNEEWSALVRLGIVTEVGTKTALVLGEQEMPVVATADGAPLSEAVYGFSHGWMMETLRKRMLMKQRRKLTEIYKLVVKQREEATRVKFMETAMNKLVIETKGWLHVRKDHARNPLKTWKKRWVALQGNELVQYYDDNNSRKLEVIDLKGAGTKASVRPGGFVGVETNFGEKHYPFCFTIHATLWGKKGVEMKESRDFLMAAESEQEVSNWIMRISYQIDFFKLKDQSALQQAADPKLDVLPFGQHPGGDIPVLADEAPGARVSTVAGLKAEVMAEAKQGMASGAFSLSNNSLVSKITGRLSVFNDPSAGPQISNAQRIRAKSTNPGQPLPAEFSNPGALVQLMSSSYFKAITRDDALLTFWTPDDMQGAGDFPLDYLRASHNVQWFIEFGEMFLVSLNGKGTIDGYLMGYVSARTPEHAIIHQCAVVPSVRRQGVATKLYAKFGELALQRKCHIIRVLVPRSRPGAIAFHRAFGFDELPEEAERIKGFNGAEISVFIRTIESEGVIVSR